MSDENTELLLDAAVAMVAAHGPDRAAMAMVARKSGLGASTTPHAARGHAARRLRPDEIARLDDAAVTRAACGVAVGTEAAHAYAALLR